MVACEFGITAFPGSPDKVKGRGRVNPEAFCNFPQQLLGSIKTHRDSHRGKDKRDPEAFPVPFSNFLSVLRKKHDITGRAA